MKNFKQRAYVQPDLSVLPTTSEDVLTGSGDVTTVKLDGDYVLADIYGNDAW